MKALVTTVASPVQGMLRVLVATVTVLVATVLLLGSGAPAAHAHAELVSTWPAAGSTDRPVHQVRLRFGEALAEGLAQVAVTGPAGSATSGAPVVTGSDVVVPVKPLTKAGTYSIAYRVVAADGHAEVGQYDVLVSPTSAAGAEKQAAGGKGPSTGPEGAGSASRESRTGAPEQLLPASSGAPVASGGLDLALTGGGVLALVVLLGLHLLLRRSSAPAGRTS